MSYPNNFKGLRKLSQEYGLRINSSDDKSRTSNYFWNNHREPWALNLNDSKAWTRKTPRWSGASCTKDILSTKQEMIPAPSPSNLEDLGMQGASRWGCYWGKRIHKREAPRRPLPGSSGDSSLLHLRWNIVQRLMEINFWFSHQPVQQEPLNLARHGIPMMGIRNC